MTASSAVGRVTIGSERGNFQSAGGAGLGVAQRALEMARLHANRFTHEFLLALPDNLHVYAAFEREALRVVAKGHAHYSARTIIEVLRHASALADNDPEFKLNDHFTPFYARLFTILHPQHADLFEFRKVRNLFGEYGKHEPTVGAA